MHISKWIDKKTVHLIALFHSEWIFEEYQPPLPLLTDRRNLLFYSCWTKIHIVMLYHVISVVCLHCPILTLPYFFISQQMECSRLPVYWRNLSQEHGCKLFSPVHRDFIFTAQQSSQCMLSCLSPRRIEKQDAVMLHFRISPLILAFSDTLLAPPPSLSLSLSTHFHPSVLYDSLFYPDCTALAKPVHTKCRYVLIFRLIFVTNLIPKHYIWELCPPSCSEDHCTSKVAGSDTNRWERCSISHEFEQIRCS